MTLIQMKGDPMSFRRIPKEIDPRRPPKRRNRDTDADAVNEARSYGQYVEMTPEEIAELEAATGEVVREGASQGEADADEASDRAARRQREAREAFEEVTDEVSREDGESNN